MIILSIVISMAMLFSCENEMADVKQFEQAELLPSHTSRNVELIYSDSAEMIMKLTAPKVDRFVADTAFDEFPEGIKLIFYNSAGKRESQITADYAVNYVGVKRMEARRDVVVINKEGERIFTEHLVWDMEKELITSDEFVKIQTGTQVIFGDGLEAKQDFSAYKILNIKGIIEVDDEIGESK